MADVQNSCARITAMPAKKKQRRTDAEKQQAAHLKSLLDRETAHLYQALESEEDIPDEEIDAIEAALERLEPQRKEATQPVSALTREAMVAAYGARYDRGEQFWCDKDAVHRQGQRTVLEAITKEDHRFGRMEVPVLTPDGTVRLVERAVVQGEAGQLTVLGEDSIDV